MHEWALREFRSTSPWAVGQALAALGRHHSRPWIGRIDMPTAVIVNTRDKVIPAERQVRLARSIPGATIHEVQGRPRLLRAQRRAVRAGVLEAAQTVNARRRTSPAAAVSPDQRAATALRSRSSSAGKCRTSASPSGTDSRQAIAPTWTMPALDITVMLRPAPWKTGPSG